MGAGALRTLPFPLTVFIHVDWGCRWHLSVRVGTQQGGIQTPGKALGSFPKKLTAYGGARMCWNCPDTHVDCGYMMCEHPPSSRHALPRPLSDLRARLDHGNKSPSAVLLRDLLSLLLSSLLPSTCLPLSPFPQRKGFPLQGSFSCADTWAWERRHSLCALGQGWPTSLRTVKFRQEYLPQRWADEMI